MLPTWKVLAVSSVQHSRVLVDTGPLVAMLSERDSNHKVAVKTLKRIAPPMLTAWPVLTEAQWMMKQNSGSIRQMLELIEKGILKLLPMDEKDLVEMQRLFKKFQSLTPQLADIALFHLAARERISTIFTFDRRDFAAFARSAKGTLTLLPEDF